MKIKKDAAVYVLEFLPKMQTELQEAIDSCVIDRKLEREKPIRYIRRTCGHETLPKLIDEHNFVIYTKTQKFGVYLEELRKQNEITAIDYKRLARKIPLA